MSHKIFVLSASALFIFGAATGRAAPADAPVVWWRFDEGAGPGLLESVRGDTDVFSGHTTVVPGVVGSARRFDGLTAFARRPAAGMPTLAAGFSVEAWVAVGAYPYHWTSIADQGRVPSQGYSFGIDEFGRVGLYLSAGGRWQGVRAPQGLPLYGWNHVVGVFVPGTGITLYVNGSAVASQAIKDSFTPAGTLDLLIGRSRSDERPADAIRLPACLLEPSFFDGIIDELKIYARPLTAVEIAALGPATPPAKPDFPARLLPSGPKGAGSFGAFHTRLSYYPEWDRLWRVGDHADVVVRFDGGDHRFVLWRGTSYIPAWVTNGIWFTNEFNETWGDNVIGCAEPMSDKQTKFSQVRIIESSDARVVIHWRYALVDTRLVQARPDPITGWGDWSDEIYVIYPDVVGTRKVTLHSSQPLAPHEFHESIVIMGPGFRPEDVIETDALTTVNMRGESHTWSWRDKAPAKIDRPARANIMINNIKAKMKPFVAVSDKPCVGANPAGVRYDAPRIRPYNAEIKRDRSMFPWWNHWPAASIACDGRVAAAADRASHSSLTTGLEWEDHEVTETTRTRIMMHGLSSGGPEDLARLAKSWLHAPPLRVTTGDYRDDGYDPTERAYRVSAQRPDLRSALKFAVAATVDAPVEGLALVVTGWGARQASLILNGRDVPVGKRFRIGHRKTLAGTDLVVWIETRATSELRISLAPVAK